MAILSKGTTYADGDQITSTNLNALVDSATFAAGAVESGGGLQLNGSTPAQLKVAGNVDIGTSNLTATGSISLGATTFNDNNITNVGSIAVDTIIADNTDVTIDAAGDIILDSGGADILLKDDGTQFGRLANSSSNLVVASSISDKDILFQGSDGGSTITALTLDMSAAGAATFNDKITAVGTSVFTNLDVSGDVDFGGIVTISDTTPIIRTISNSEDLTLRGGNTDAGGQIKLFGSTASLSANDIAYFANEHEFWNTAVTEKIAFQGNEIYFGSAEDVKLYRSGADTLKTDDSFEVAVNLDVDGTTNLDAVDIDGAVQIDSTLTVGVDDTGHDVKFFGATSGSYMQWDESTDDLILGGAARLGIGTTAPGSELEVKGAGSEIFINSSDSAFSRVAHQHNGTSIWTTGTRSASDYHIFRESGSGNVIIDNGTLSCVLANGVTATTQSASDNSTKVATTAYVDAQVTAEDLDFAGDSGSGSVDLDSQTFTIAGATGLDTTASSQTLTVSLDLNELATETSIAQDDFVAMVDNTDSGNGKITFSNLEDQIFGNVSGAVAIAAGGAATVSAVTVADESSDTTCFPLFATAATGSLGPKSGSNLTFNSSSGLLTATTLSGILADGVTATTQSDGDNSTKVATTAYVDAATGGGEGGAFTTLTASGDVNFDSGTFFVDASANKVGIGRDSPDVELHVTDGNGTEPTFGAGTVAVFQNNDNTGDNCRINILAGTAASSLLEFGDSGDSDVGQIEYSHNANQMNFRVNAGTQMSITSGGHLRHNFSGTGDFPGLQNDTHGLMAEDQGSSGDTLHVSRKGNHAANFARNTNDGTLIGFYSTAAGGTSAASLAGTIEIDSATTVSIQNASDYRLKENIVSVTDGIDRLKQMPVYKFNFTHDANRVVDGFLAHEVQSQVPEAVKGEKDAMKDEEYMVSPAVYEDVVHPAVEATYDENGDKLTSAVEEWTENVLVTEKVMGTRTVPRYQTMDQSKLVPLLTAALQEAVAKIEALEARVQTLEG